MLKVLVEDAVEGKDISIPLGYAELAASAGMLKRQVPRFAQAQADCHRRLWLAIPVVVVVPRFRVRAIPVEVHPAIHQRELEGGEEAGNKGREVLRAFQSLAIDLKMPPTPMQAKLGPAVLDVCSQGLQETVVLSSASEFWQVQTDATTRGRGSKLRVQRPSTWKT